MSPEGRDLGQEAGPGRDKVSSFDSWPEKGQRCFEGQTAPGAVHGEPAQRFRRREIQHEEIQQQNGGQAEGSQPSLSSSCFVLFSHRAQLWFPRTFLGSVLDP
jgi:hypothetical protein